MLKKIFILISIHLCIKCRTQSNDPSLIIYNQGIAAYQKNQFAKADSFYTLSLKLRPDADTYFNRAMSRLKLINKTGYYEDLICAGSLGYKESDDLLHSHARTIDTLRYFTTCVIGNDSSTNAYIYMTYTLRDIDTKLELKYDARKTLLNISWFKEILPDTSVAEKMQSTGEALKP